MRTFGFELKCREDFNLEKIIKNKPFFFFFSEEPTRGFVLEKARVVVYLQQKGERLIVDGKVVDGDFGKEELEFLKQRLAYCFGVEEDLDSFYVLVENDEVLSKIYDDVYGLRLLSAFDNFEALLSIICSQNASYWQYKSMVRSLVNSYGQGLFFPTPKQIAKEPEKLYKAKLGYRIGFVEEIVKYFVRNSRFKDVDVEDIARIKGIGKYSLDAFLLFQKRDYSFFYTDRLMVKLFRELYGFDGKRESELKKFARKKFENYAGLAGYYLQKFSNKLLFMQA